MIRLVPTSCPGAVWVRLEIVKIVGNALRVSGRENGVLAFAEYVEPMANVVGVIGADLRRNAEVGCGS
jgi:hypothetical protein